MFKNPEPIEINLFSRLGITIALSIVVPIFSFLVFALYFPETFKTTIIKLGIARYDYPSTNSSARIEQPPSGQSRTFLGTSPTGYELWKEGECVYVKGLRESDLQRLSTDIGGFKEAIKLQTGASCVFFE